MLKYKWLPDLKKNSNSKTIITQKVKNNNKAALEEINNKSWKFFYRFIFWHDEENTRRKQEEEEAENQSPKTRLAFEMLSVCVMMCVFGFLATLLRQPTRCYCCFWQSENLCRTPQQQSWSPWFHTTPRTQKFQSISKPPTINKSQYVIEFFSPFLLLNNFRIEANTFLWLFFAHTSLEFCAYWCLSFFSCYFWFPLWFCAALSSGKVVGNISIFKKKYTGSLLQTLNCDLNSMFSFEDNATRIAKS